MGVKVQLKFHLLVVNTYLLEANYWNKAEYKIMIIRRRNI